MDHGELVTVCPVTQLMLVRPQSSDRPLCQAGHEAVSPQPDSACYFIISHLRSYSESERERYSLYQNDKHNKSL